ncbi:MAG: hypothetical protein CBC95_006855 [Crocinitomicaceae bacterium TMED135]|nr:MAG: hypothetical protein CBC95_006855 [Crocinitomicaceae bacterium TMED135]
MKHFITSIVLLFITVSISAQTKEETKAQNRTDEIVELLSLNKDETLKVYEALLAKEKKITILKEEYKDNQETFKAEIRMLTRATNRVMKDFLGGESMQKIHAHFRAKRENSKK